LTESKKAQQELRKAALDAARLQKKVKKGIYQIGKYGCLYALFAIKLLSILFQLKSTSALSRITGLFSVADFFMN